jgi:hypothetical protein
VSCYLCAYLQPQKPATLRSLPKGSPASQDDELGTCKTCSVWACSMHGHRYSPFQCAMCVYATAATQALVAPATGNAAATVAHLTGSQASPAILGRVAGALDLIVADGRRQADDRWDTRRLVAPDDGPDNLVANLADVIRYRAGGPRAFVPAVWDADLVAYGAALADAAPAGPVPPGAVSIDAVGGSVREAFAGREFIDPTGPAVTIAAGSLLLAYSLADVSIAARGIEQPVSWPGAVDRLSPPWAVSHPVLLDPVIWMVATAYLLSQGTDADHPA